VTLLRATYSTQVEKALDEDNEEYKYFYLIIERGLQRQVQDSHDVWEVVQKLKEIKMSFSTNGASFFKQACKTKTRGLGLFLGNCCWMT
jgi:hypothetical protein